MNKVVIIALIVIVLAGGVYLFIKQQNNQQASQMQSAQQSQQQTQQQSNTQSQPTTAQSSSSHSVDYTANGFEPNTITIKVGESVTWTNKDSDDMWVASNPHPTHTDYPGFDALKNIPTGSTYSFTFSKVGKWGYHNHLNPSQQGTVVVTQ